MKKRWFERDWVWIVGVPSAFIGLVFVFGMALRGCVG